MIEDKLILNDEERVLVVGGAFIGLLLSFAGNFYVTAFYDLFAQTLSIKRLILFDSGLGLLILIIWFSKKLSRFK